VQGRLNPVFDSLFINSLRDTGRLVFAIQAVQTVLFSSAYYRNLFSYDVEGQATMRRFIPSQVPIRWRGLIVVGSFVALHFVLLISTIRLYVSSQSFRNLSSPSPTANYSALENDGNYIGNSAGTLVEAQTKFDIERCLDECVGNQSLSIDGYVLTTILIRDSSLRYRATLQGENK